MHPFMALKPLFLTCTCLILLGCKNTPTEVKVEQLLKADKSWDGAAYRYPDAKPEFTVVKITLPANTTLKWHSHPMPNLAYLVSGELMVETEDGIHKTTLKPGQVLPEVVNTSHRGISGKVPVELIVFYAGAPGMALSH